MVNSLKSWRPGGRVHGGWGWIHTAWVTSVWVTSLFQCTAAQLSITPDVVTAAVGETVTLSLRYKGGFRYVEWFRGGGTDADDVILSLFGSDPPTYGPQSTGRESVLPDGSLRITDVRTDHSGNYTVIIYMDPGGLQEATAQLRVHAWVTSLFQCTVAQLSINPDVLPAAVGETVTLSLRYKGGFRYVEWFRGGGTDADDVILSLFGSDPPTYGPQSTGRESVLPDGSLRITDVQMDHSGNYTVIIYMDPGGLQEATAQLRVHVPEAGGNKIRTSTPMIVSIPERGAPPASDASCSSWWVTLAVASGMLLGAVVAVLGVVLFYERRLKKAEGATRGGSRRFIYEPAVNYGNVETGNRAQAAAQSPDADHTYMALKHGDQATYDHLQRPQN